MEEEVIEKEGNVRKILPWPSVFLLFINAKFNS
jgi:hypothetical protein